MLTFYPTRIPGSKKARDPGSRIRNTVPEALDPGEEPLPQLLLMMGQVIVAAALAVRVEGPRLVRQPSRGLTHGPAARGATCRLAAAGGGGGGCMVVDGGDGVCG